MPSLSADTENLFLLPADSDTVIVAFGPRGAPEGRPPYLGLLGQVPGYSKIVVRDPHNAWFQAGLPGIGDSLDLVAERLRLEISALGATRVFTFGGSMGGYAAILFGCLLGVERAIAFAPQTFLDPLLRHGPPGGIRLQAPDLEPVARDTGDVEIDLVVPWDDLVDVVHARNLARLPSVRVLAVATATHGFMDNLHRAGELAPSLSKLERRTIPEFAQPAPALSVEEDRRIRDAAFADQAGEWRTARDRIEPVAAGHPLWAAPSFQLGKALLNLGEAVRAEGPLRGALEENPRMHETRACLSQVLEEQGRGEEAARILREGVSANPRWTLGWLRLAQLLEKLGRAEEARGAAREAEQTVRRLILEHPRLPMGQRLLSQVLLMQGRFGEAQGAILLADRHAKALAAKVPPASAATPTPSPVAGRAPAEPAPGA